MKVRYYDDGSLKTKTDRNNHVITYIYTRSGKPESVIYPDASTVVFIYDLRDNLVAMEDSLGITRYQYDAANRLTSVTDPHGFTTAYRYDEGGNLTELVYPGGKVVAYTYDALNRLDTVTIRWLGMTAVYAYDDAGRVITLDHFNGTSARYGYDNADRLTDLENKRPGGSVISAYHFTLDGNGNRIQTDREEPLEVTLNADDLQYTYNEKRNRLLTAGASGFSYDNEGQLAQGAGVLYGFDYEHRLVSVNSGAQARYFYDGSGTRLKAIRDGVTSYYIHDASGNLLAEADNSKQITRYYIYGQGLLAMATASNDLYCCHFDATGNTIAITDEAQEIVNSYAYTPFGIIVGKQEMLPQPFKYVGQYGVMAEPNGLYYMRARYYDPQTGRFISEDPIGFDGGDTNLYVYVANNPVLRIDSSGLAVFLGSRAIHGFSKQYGAFHHEFLLIENTRFENDVASFGLTANFIIGKGIIAVNDDWDINYADHDGNLVELIEIDEDSLIDSIIKDQSNPPYYIFGIHDCQWWARSRSEQSRMGPNPKP